MKAIGSVEELEAHYGVPRQAAVDKVRDRLTGSYRKWVEASRFCILSTVGPGGTDASPRGDDGPVVEIADAKTLLLPDWRGNDRIDSLRNIVSDGRVSLMFLVPGAPNVVRINGSAVVSADANMRARFERHGRRPRSVIVIAVSEVYFQCARAVMRAQLWSGAAAPADLPTAGRMLQVATSGGIDGDGYDRTWTRRAARTMW